MVSHIKGTTFIEGVENVWNQKEGSGTKL